MVEVTQGEEFRLGMAVQGSSQEGNPLGQSQWSEVLGLEPA